MYLTIRTKKDFFYRKQEKIFKVQSRAYMVMFYGCFERGFIVELLSTLSVFNHAEEVSHLVDTNLLGNFPSCSLEYQ